MYYLNVEVLHFAGIERDLSTVVDTEEVHFNVKPRRSFLTHARVKKRSK